MQLNPGEKSLMTYFFSEDKALMAMDSLQKSGFRDVQLSYVTEYPQHKLKANPRYLSNKVLGNGHYDQNYGPLLAADPSVSGISGQHDAFIPASYLVTVVTSANDLETARQILQDYEAYQ